MLVANSHVWFKNEKKCREAYVLIMNFIKRKYKHKSKYISEYEKCDTIFYKDRFLSKTQSESERCDVIIIINDEKFCCRHLFNY